MPAHAAISAHTVSACADPAARPVRVTAPGVQQSPAGVALSPDGTKVAVALPGSPATRVLDATAPDGDLVASSRQLAVIGTPYATLSSFTCHAAQGWQLITVAKGAAAGQGIVCGASTQSGRYTPCTSPTDTKCKYTQRNSIGFLRATQDSRGASYLGLDIGSDCPSQAEPGNGAYIGWANADGSEVIGSQVCAGHSRYGSSAAVRSPRCLHCRRPYRCRPAC